MSDKKRFGIIIDATLAETARVLAALQGVTRNQFIVDAIEQHCEHAEKQLLKRGKKK